jgi:predicted DNA binding CopG/RHH family protein
MSHRPHGAQTILEQVVIMRKEYDFSKAKKNPYASMLKKQVTIRLDEGTVDYFKNLANEAGIPYQTLINLYLRDCAASERKLSMNWKVAS